jgi:adenylylsulfate reductase, subunit B
MPTYVDMMKCDGCGECVQICPSDIMHIDPVYRRAYNIEPNFCWECYSCVKYCPQHAIDVRGYADFAPLGHKVRVLREKEKGSVSWKIRYRDGREKQFTFPIRTTPWGSIKSAAAYEAPDPNELASPMLSHEPAALKVPKLPSLPRGPGWVPPPAPSRVGSSSAIAAVAPAPSQV